MKDIRKQMQQSLSDHDDYILKTDEQLIEIISNFGCGETEFHTADIECLIKEKEQLQQNQTKLVQALFEAFKSGRFSVIDDRGNGLLESWERFKASQTMKEVCGEENLH